MAKPRTAIPQAIRDAVLREFNHRCAIDGADNPQLHHIDEDPSNNEPLNLIPLCPNCHITDQHNPTGKFDPALLLLFRIYKDPVILSPQFMPLFRRLRFLDDITDTTDTRELRSKAEELCRFVAVLDMGEFYKQEIGNLIERPRYVPNPHDQEAAARRYSREYRERLRAARDKVYSLVVELLRYQSWEPPRVPRS